VNTVQPELPGARQRSEWGSIAQLFFSGLGFLGFAALALFAAITGVSNQVSQGNLTGQTTSSLTLAWSYFFVAGLLILSMGSAVLHLISGEEPDRVRRFFSALHRLLTWSILAWPFVLLAGYFLTNNERLSWILLPPVHILAVGLPIIWLVHMGRRGLRTGSVQRSLGTLTAGMVGSFALSFIAEMVVLVVILLVGYIVIASNPTALLDLNRLASRIANSQMDPEVISRALRPYLSDPRVIFVGLVFISGFVPLIEEFFKPLAIWFLGRRLQSPADGFAAGLLAGSGFALVESLGQAGSVTGPSWLLVEVGRSGTDLLHIVTAGIMGWALVSAWRRGRWWLAGLAYLLVIILHGLWNGLTLGIGLAPFINFSPATLPYSQEFEFIAPFGLGILVIVLLIILLRTNHVFRTANIERTQNADHSTAD
jgi:RsiW-degrading membrane proteinase PrsW (M82 family)